MGLRQLDQDVLQERWIINKDGELEQEVRPVPNDERVEDHLTEFEPAPLRKTNIVILVREFEW